MFSWGALIKKTDEGDKKIRPWLLRLLREPEIKKHIDVWYFDDTLTETYKAITSFNVTICREWKERFENKGSIVLMDKYGDCEEEGMQCVAVHRINQLDAKIDFGNSKLCICGFKNE